MLLSDPGVKMCNNLVCVSLQVSTVTKCLMAVRGNLVVMEAPALWLATLLMASSANVHRLVTFSDTFSQWSFEPDLRHFDPVLNSSALLFHIHYTSFFKVNFILYNHTLSFKRASTFFIYLKK